MKKYLISFLTIGVVCGCAIWAYSGAQFSDTEKSTGNTFTTGGIDLTVDSKCTYNGQAVTDGQCGTWVLKNLLPGSDKFFNFGDIKPGDWGENTISLHIENNPSWACLRIDNMHNDDNGLTEPEQTAGDTTNGADQGELAQNLFFTAWADDGDNKWETGEPLLFTNKFGPAIDVLNGKTYAIADITTGGQPLQPGNTTYIGLQWCAGAMTVTEGTNTITCDKAGMGNQVQTDSLTADMTFYVEQSKNNDKFTCSSWNPNESPRPTTSPGTVFDTLDIGNTTDESGHALGDWSNEWVSGGWGGVYGGGSSDHSFRLLMGKGDTCTESDREATFTMSAGSNNATKLILEHLDGQVNDSFDVFINDNNIGSYPAGLETTEAWKTSTFTFSPVTGTVNVRLRATEIVGAWCDQWGQVAFSNAKLTN